MTIIINCVVFEYNFTINTRYTHIYSLLSDIHVRVSIYAAYIIIIAMYTCVYICMHARTCAYIDHLDLRVDACSVYALLLDSSRGLAAKDLQVQLIDQRVFVFHLKAHHGGLLGVRVVSPPAVENEVQLLVGAAGQRCFHGDAVHPVIDVLDVQRPCLARVCVLLLVLFGADDLVNHRRIPRPERKGCQGREHLLLQWVADETIQLLLLHPDQLQHSGREVHHKAIDAFVYRSACEHNSRTYAHTYKYKHTQK